MKPGKIIFALLQLLVGSFLMWSLLRVPAPPFNTARWFFVPAYYIVEASISLMMLFQSVNTIRKAIINHKA